MSNLRLQNAAANVATTTTATQPQVAEALHSELKTSAKDGEEHTKFIAFKGSFPLKVMKLHRHHSLFKAGRIEDLLDKHRAIMDALVSRDARLAVQRMQAHSAHRLEPAA